MTANHVPAASASASGPHGAVAGVAGRSAPSQSRRPDGARWSVGALLLALGAILWFLVSLMRDIEAAAFTRLDLEAVRVDFGPGWTDPRWNTWIAQQLGELPDMNADGAATSEILRASLEDLPFVAEVSEVRVLWPDGVRAELRLRSPVACVRTGDGFALVSEEGVVLPGEWNAPPPRSFGFFPLLAGASDDRAEIQAGGWLEAPCWTDGLSIARALEAQLAADDWIRLGRVVIDARHARLASVERPGAVLWLDGGRRAYFGRSPNLDEPGELPVVRKCAALARALRLLDDGPEHLDWELVDLRWDQPEILPRGGFEAPRGEPRDGR